jgi:hypothetical protein
MRYLFTLATVWMLVGVGCATQVSAPQSISEEPKNFMQTPPVLPEVVLPVEEYGERRIMKSFGEYIEDRFTGYHVGDDIEFVDVTGDVPVVAIADGVVQYAKQTPGYGGLVVLEHEIGDEQIHALYGHLDLGSSALAVGDLVQVGQFLANLGEHESEETDGERKHLHFALYSGEGLRLHGYVDTATDVHDWLNPQDFFVAQGILIEPKLRKFDSVVERGGDIFKLGFEIPAGWAVEYIPSLEALNLFIVSGEGVARERSQILIRYFDAARFLTLSTVEIFETTDMIIGEEEYVARRYDIEKKQGVADFRDQPSWRNDRHIVTDFRDTSGFTRYYVVAANPALETGVYEALLKSMIIIP